MIYLALAVGCSLGIGMIFKYAGQRRMDRIELLTANYLAAVAVAVPLLYLDGGFGEELEWSGGLIALGGFTGALFIAGFFLLSLATDLAGMGLSVGVMRVSVVIPFVASWVIWDEVPSIAQGAGLVLAGVAFFMISRKNRPERNVLMGRNGDDASPLKIFAVLALVFVVGGLVDTMMKAFDEEYGADNSRALFLLLIFGVAFSLGLAIKLRDYLRGARPDSKTLLLGGLLGVVNYGSVEFLLRAIRALSGPFVFPANNIAIVIGAALLGVFFWRERLSHLNWLGLAIASVALVLLNF